MTDFVYQIKQPAFLAFVEYQDALLEPIADLQKYVQCSKHVEDLLDQIKRACSTLHRPGVSFDLDVILTEQIHQLMSVSFKTIIDNIQEIIDNVIFSKAVERKFEKVIKLFQAWQDSILLNQAILTKGEICKHVITEFVADPSTEYCRSGTEYAKFCRICGRQLTEFA